MFLLRHRRPSFKTIDPTEEKIILDLHEQHPELGRKRLYEALRERGVDIDPFQLKQFLRSHNIGSPPPIRQARPLWSRVPWHPWLDYGRGRSK